MAKSSKLVPKTIADTSTKKYLQDLRDDVEGLLTAGKGKLWEGKVTDQEVVTILGKGAFPVIDGFALSVTQNGDNIRMVFTTGSPGKKLVRVWVVG